LDYASARRNMVDGQLRTNRVNDPRIIAAFETLPRERFVPEDTRGFAYIDEDLEVAPGRWLMEPMVLARLLQGAEIGDEESVLIVAAGTGYAAAAAASLARKVVALEEDPALAEQARRVLQELAIENVTVVTAALEEGYSAEAPYDVIIIDGAVEEVPDAYGEQLVEGGRLLAVVRPPAGVGRGRLYRKNGTLSSRVLFDAATPVLESLRKARSFVF